MRDKFDFEQQIMSVWQIIEEIKGLRKNILEGKPDGARMTLDDVDNFLLGLESIYGLKFDQLWHDFENIFFTFSSALSLTGVAENPIICFL